MIPVKTLVCHYDGVLLRLPGDEYECDDKNEADFIASGFIIATGAGTPDVAGSPVTDPALAQSEIPAL